MINKDLLPYLGGLDSSTQDRLKKALNMVQEGDESDLEPVQVRDIEPLKTWLRSRYYNVMARSLYEYWEHEIIDFCENGYNEWVITGSIGTGKSTAALVTCQRKLYEMSCFERPQRLFRLADMTKIFFAYLSVNIKQAELTGFGQIREQIDSTPYFQEHYPRDSKIQSVMRFPGDVFFIPGSDQISFIGTNLFGCILDEMNFLRSKGGSVGDVSKAQTIYQEATDRRRSRFMYKGKDPGFSLLVSSSTVQTSFTASRIKAAEQQAKKGIHTTKVTSTKLWEVKPKGTYSDRVFYVFNGSERDDAFLIEEPEDLLDVMDDPQEKERLKQAAQATRHQLLSLAQEIDQEIPTSDEELDPTPEDSPASEYPQEEEWIPGPAYPLQGASGYSSSIEESKSFPSAPEDVEIASWDSLAAPVPKGGLREVAQKPWTGEVDPEDPCPLCHGEGWVWGSELSPPEDPPTDQRYSCPGVGEWECPAGDRSSPASVQAGRGLVLEPRSLRAEPEGGEGADVKCDEKGVGVVGRGVSMPQGRPPEKLHVTEIMQTAPSVLHDKIPDLGDLIKGRKFMAHKKVSDPHTETLPNPQVLRGSGPKPVETVNFDKVSVLKGHPVGSNPLMDAVWKYLPPTLAGSISRVPVDFRESFDGDLYTALKNIAGISISPSGKLFTARGLWARACKDEIPNPFRKESFPLTMKGPDQIFDYFQTDKLFRDGEMISLPYAPRYIRVDQSKNTDCTGIACVHRAGWTNAQGGIREPVIGVDFVIRIQPPPKPDRIGFHKIRNFILALRDLGMKIGGVSFDQYQSEDHMQILELQGLKASYLSVDRTDKAYLTVVNLLNEGRLVMYPYEPLRNEFFNLDWDRAKGKVDHPSVNPDGSKGTKDVADAFVGSVFECVNGLDTAVPVRQEALDEIRAVGPTVQSRRAVDRQFDWVLPKEYRGKVQIEVVKKGPEKSGWDPRE